ncbi:ferric reductase-like transmembrane domain-containing protein [Schaalia suimastitidis]|uniref:ferredoxin reductase family protein n=1 Tax=Schaalia suimastitidis TaxID=121163 RepID=UPI00040ED47C|nr:ferric reductase-like transmembrane domain-containing protein [Schaalia suimastitidis]
MTVLHSELAFPGLGTRAIRAKHRTLRASRPLGTIADPMVTAIFALGLGISLGLTAMSLMPFEAHTTSVIYAVQAVAAVTGTYLTLVLLLLIARIPILDRTLGHDGVVRAHKTLGPWAVWLIALHVLLVVPLPVVGAQWPAQMWQLVTSDIWVALAALGTLLLLAVGISSWRRLRSRIARSTWWSIHLYAYVAIALAFGHQILSGGPFTSGWARLWWMSLYVIVFTSILTWRVIVPAVRNHQMQLRVHAVVQESTDTSSVWISGHGINRLGAQAGQFITVRFWEKGLFWEGHPYSLSAPPRPDMLRITVKALGDASSATQSIQPGTRVFIEGPHGIMTARAQRHSHALLIAGGVGIAPMRALAESLAANHYVDLVVRSRTWDDLALREELRQLSESPTVTVHFLIGSRQQHPMNAELINPLVSHFDGSDIYACGPRSMMDDVIDATRRLKIPRERVHIDSFDM